MFLDRVKIYVKAGNGGNGSVSFRREKYVPNGGPDGGDGGRGGNIVFQVNPGDNTLLAFRYHRKFLAEDGGAGMGGKKHGKNACCKIKPSFFQIILSSHNAKTSLVIIEYITNKSGFQYFKRKKFSTLNEKSVLFKNRPVLRQ